MARKKSQVAVVSEENDRQPVATLVSAPKTLVFISHDSRDADLAEAFANLLSDVSAGTLKSFRSSDKKGTSGIEFGTEWYTAIMSQLDSATDVVALLTQHSIDRPWILYEAGVAKGKLDTNVLGVAIGVPLDKVSSGPFGQFQNCGDDEDSLTKLVIQLLKRNPDASPREAALRIQVKVFQDKAADILKQKALPSKSTPAPSDDSNIAKLFEETKIMIRELPSIVERRVAANAERGVHRPSRRSKYRLMEILQQSTRLHGDRVSVATMWLILICTLKDELPWVYELGLELYRAFQGRSLANVRNAQSEFIGAIESTTRTPYFDVIVRDEEIHFVVRHLAELSDQFVARFTEEIRTPRSRPVDTSRDNEESNV